MKIERLLYVQGTYSCTNFVLYATKIPDLQDVPVRNRYRTEHFYAINLLSTVLQQDYEIYHAMLSRDEQGKPQLIHPFLHMNWSHCKGLCVLGIGNCPIGVDVEPPRQVREAVLDRVCLPSEKEEILSENDVDASFSRYWTLKEAYGKWHGGGIRLPLDKIPFSLKTDKIQFLHEKANEFSFYQLIYEPDEIPYTVSVCVPRIPFPLINSESARFYTN